MEIDENNNGTTAITPEGLVRRGDVPLFRQVYARIRDAVLSGTLPAGTRLPSTRSLASQLAISRGTIETAYDLLVSEGYVAGRGAAGTIVDPHFVRPSAIVTGSRDDATPPVPNEPLGGETAMVTTTPLPRPFQLGVPALDAFPVRLWSRLVARRARDLTTPALVYQDPAGYPPLRQAIATYVRIARGIDCTADHVFVTPGFQGALGLIAHALLASGDAAWVEDPVYPLARQALAYAGVRLVPVRVDSEGLDVAIGLRRAPQARLAVVTPAHQMPLGVSLSLPRRLALLAWAAGRDAWIVEDDYDGEYRYVGRPLPALKSLDAAGRVLYVGTFGKVLFPGLRLGYVVVPDAQVDRFARACQLLQPNGNPLGQMVVTDFIDGGYFSRHIRKMRGLYLMRRTALIRALTETFGDRLLLDVQTGGMHILARLTRGEHDTDIARRAAAHGIAPGALSTFGIEAALDPALLLGFPNIPAERVAEEVMRLQRAMTV